MPTLPLLLMSFERFSLTKDCSLPEKNDAVKRDVEALQLDFNQCRECVPVEWGLVQKTYQQSGGRNSPSIGIGRIPPKLGQLKALRILDLINNGLRLSENNFDGEHTCRIWWAGQVTTSPQSSEQKHSKFSNELHVSN
ncbi:hypothetical protein SUGI_0957930 [Cryptomeria japonica]|nr:hypothetical protein SUGI_0957930 [Cryptomeria japonica]